MISVKLEDKKFQRQLEQLRKKHAKRLHETVSDSTFKLQKLAMNDAPVDDGALRRGIKANISHLKGEVVSNANYSQAVEEGTKPHHIEVKNKKVLAGAARKAPAGMATSNGWAIYGSRVQHPGTKPQPFMKPAFTVAKNYLVKQIKKLF